MAAFGAALPSASVPTPPRVETVPAAPPAREARDPARDLTGLALVRVLTPTDIVTAEPAGRKPGRVFRFMGPSRAAWAYADAS